MRKAAKSSEKAIHVCEKHRRDRKKERIEPNTSNCSEKNKWSQLQKKWEPRIGGIQV